MSYSGEFWSLMLCNYICRLEGLEYEVLQWCICRLEAWFATDTDNISLKNWDQVCNAELWNIHMSIKNMLYSLIIFSRSALHTRTQLHDNHAELCKFAGTCAYWWPWSYGEWLWSCHQSSRSRSWYSPQPQVCRTTMWHSDCQKIISLLSPFCVCVAQGHKDHPAL